MQLIQLFAVLFVRIDGKCSLPLFLRQVHLKHAPPLFFFGRTLVFVHRCLVHPFVHFRDLIGFPFRLLVPRWGNWKLLYVCTSCWERLVPSNSCRYGERGEVFRWLPDWPRNGLDLSLPYNVPSVTSWFEGRPLGGSSVVCKQEGESPCFSFPVFSHLHFQTFSYLSMPCL